MDDPEALKKLIEDVIHSRDILYLWAFIVLALVAAGGAYLGAYLKRKGENWATHEDAVNILRETEKTTQATEDIKTRIARRSDLEKQILLDQYKIVTDLEGRIVRIASNLNRLRQGVEVPDFIKDGDVVPLTAVFEDLSINRWLLKDRFHSVLADQANLLLKMANIKDLQHWTAAEAEYKRLSDMFAATVQDVFGIERITWMG